MPNKKQVSKETEGPAPKEGVPEESPAKGGKKAAESKGRQKLLKEMVLELLDTELPDEDRLRARLEAKGLDATEGMAMLYAQLAKAKDGVTTAAQFIRDTAGQKPADSIALGNLGGKPFEILDLSGLSDAELTAMALGKAGDGEG